MQTEELCLQRCGAEAGAGPPGCLGPSRQPRSPYLPASKASREPRPLPSAPLYQRGHLSRRQRVGALPRLPPPQRRPGQLVPHPDRRAGGHAGLAARRGRRLREPAPEPALCRDALRLPGHLPRGRLAEALRHVPPPPRRAASGHRHRGGGGGPRRRGALPQVCLLLGGTSLPPGLAAWAIRD